jgi:peptidoglycan/xylan/chitin deacetylase (PgdA/CDA1 family)
MDQTELKIVSRSAVWLLHAFQTLLGKRSATIVVYHSINEPPDRYTISPSSFARQVRFLRDHFTIIRLRDIPLALAQLNDQRLKIAITFDDALADFQQNAYEVLRELQVPATVFVPTGLIGRTNEWDAHIGRRTLPIMTSDQIQALAAEGLIDFGSHSVTHPDFGKLSEQEIRWQAEESKRALERLLGVRVTMFAYPYGGYRVFSRRTARLLHDAGYDLAVTTVWGTRQSRQNLLTLRRVDFNDSDTNKEIGSKVNGDYDWRGVREGVGHVLRTVKQITPARGNG